jgi:hypothetical protein
MLAPLPLVYVGAAMSFAYKGPLTVVYVTAALAIAGFCIWRAINIFRGTIAPWSPITWIFLALELFMLVKTMIPPPVRK